MAQDGHWKPVVYGGAGPESRARAGCPGWLNTNFILFLEVQDIVDADGQESQQAVMGQFDELAEAV